MIVHVYPGLLWSSTALILLKQTLSTVISANFPLMRGVSDCVVCSDCWAVFAGRRQCLLAAGLRRRLLQSGTISRSLYYNLAYMLQAPGCVMG